ncbi:hypothetical protein SJ598_13605, partial [Enterobacter bugandensis]|uniref:hypothetical protein n=1 Tax=Enterobacter bugandensis TaxID=881260 RepID=UPI0029D57949
THPKTFQLRTIAALPEPAGRPTHGLMSRRSTWPNNVPKVHSCKVPKVQFECKKSSQTHKFMNFKGIYFYPKRL